MAQWNKLDSRIKPVVTQLGAGVNTGVSATEIKDNEASDVLNSDTFHYPAFSPRKPMSSVIAAGPQSILGVALQRGGHRYVVETGKVSKWVAETLTQIATYTKGEGNSFSYTVFMDNIYFTAGKGPIRKITPADVLSSVATSPNVYLITTHKNRLYGIEDHILHYSALRKDNDWNTVDDSGQIRIDTVDGEPLTGLITFINHVTMFSEHGLYELYGTGPLNYEVVTVSTSMGTVAHATIKELRQHVVFLGADNVYQYNGGTAPRAIGYKVKKYLDRITPGNHDKATAETDGRKYFLHIPVDGSTVPNLTLVMDLDTSTWNVQSRGQIVQHLFWEDVHYFISPSSIFKEDESGAAVEWKWVSKAFSEGLSQNVANLQKLHLVVDVPEEEGGYMNVYISSTHSGEDWVLVRGISTGVGKLHKYKVLVPLIGLWGADWIRIKLEGKGNFVVYEIQRTLRVRNKEGNYNGYVQST